MSMTQQAFALSNFAAVVVDKTCGALTLNILTSAGPGVLLAGREQIESLRCACDFALAVEPPTQKGPSA